MPSDLRKHMDGLYSDVFDKILGKPKQATQISFLAFSTRADEGLKAVTELAQDVSGLPRGAEQMAAMSAGRSAVGGVNISTRGMVSEGVLSIMPQQITSEAFANRHMPTVGINKPGGPNNIMMAWSTLRDSALVARHARPGAGQTVAPTVSISGLWSKFFGDVAFEGKKTLADISTAIESGRAGGGAKGSMKFLTRAAESLILESGVTRVGDLSKSKQLEVIFAAAAEKAMETPAGLEFFKQYLANSGVPGITTSMRSLYSITDPHGINNIASAISNRAKGTAYFSPSSVGPHSLKDVATFTKKVGKFYGDDYATLLGKFMDWSIKNSAGGISAVDSSKVAFAMSHTGGIYMGEHGVSRSFMGIAAERLGARALPVSGSTGLPMGFGMVGDNLMSSRSIARPGKIETATEAFFRHMQAGMVGETGLGMGPSQLAGAIKTGHRQAMGAIKDLRVPLISRGKHSLYSAVYDIGSVSSGFTKGVGPTSFKNFYALSDELSKLAMGMVVPADYYDRMIKGLERDLEAIQGPNMGFARNMARDAIANMEMMGAEGLAGIKGKNLLQGILPNAAMSQFFLPGQLMTKEALEKGMYQRRGIEEIREIARIRQMSSSRRLLGMDPLHATISSTAGNSSARLAMGRLVESTLGRSLGLGQRAMKAGIRPVVTFPLMATVIGTRGLTDAQRLAARELFGDSGAVYSRAGTAQWNAEAKMWQGGGAIFGGTRRQMPVQKTFGTGAQLEEFLLGITGKGDHLRVRNEMEAMRTGRRPSGKAFFNEDAPLKIANRKFSLDIGRTPGGRSLAWEAAEGAEFVTGYQLPGAGRVGLDPIKIFYDTPSGTPSHVSLALNDIRMTARADANGNLAKLLGLKQTGRATLGELGDVVASAQDLKKYGAQGQWHHRIGLLGFGKSQFYHESQVSGRISKFTKLMNQETADIVKQVTTGVDTEIIPGRGYKASGGFKAFEAASSTTLGKMGYTEAQIQGRMWGGTLEAPTIRGGMAELQLRNVEGFGKGLGPDKLDRMWGGLDEAAKGYTSVGSRRRALSKEQLGLVGIFGKTKGMDIWSQVTAANLRAGETEEIARGTFRVRLSALQVQAETLPQWMEGVKGGKMTIGRHPALRIQAEYLNKGPYGGWLNIEAQTARELVNVKAVGLEPIVNLFRGLDAKYLGEGGAAMLKAESGMGVYSLEQAAKRFGNITQDIFYGGGGAIPGELALESGLFDPKINPKGFYIDVGRGKGLNLAGPEVQKSAPTTARFLPISGAEELKRMAGPGLRPGQMWKPQQGTVLDAAFRLVSNASMDTARAKDSLRSDAQVLYNALARMGGKEGFLTDDVFARAGLPGAGSGRLVPDVAGASRFLEGKAAGLTKADYVASMGEEGIRKLIKDKKAAKWVIDTLGKEGGEVFAFVQPTPLHSAAQGKLVRLKLDSTLKAGSGGAEIGLGGFLTWGMQRDNDKDNAFLHILQKKDMDRIKKLEKEGKVLGLTETINAEVSADIASYRVYKKAMLAEADALGNIANLHIAGATVGSKAEAIAGIRAMLSFGSFAATPFTGMMNTKGLLDMVAAGDVGAFQRGDIAELFEKGVTQETLDKWRSGAEANLRRGIRGEAAPGLQAATEEFALLHQPIYQAGVQKDSAKVAAYVKSYQGAQNEMVRMARAGASQEEVYTYGVAEVKKYLDTLTDSGKNMAGWKPTSASITAAVEAKHIGLRVGEDLLANQAYLAESAENLGSMNALAATIRGPSMKSQKALRSLLSTEELRAMGMTPGDIQPGAAGIRDPINRALRETDGSLLSIHRFLRQDEAIVGMASMMESSQAAAASTFDDTMRTMGDASSQVMEWSVRNWRLLAGVGVGIAAIRAAGALFGGDAMPAPSFSSARSLQFPQSNLAPAMVPRENDPGAQFNNSGFNRQRALVQPSSSQYAMSSIQGTGSSVNISGIQGSIAANVRSFSNPHVNMSIRDSRSYSSNWEMQNMANQRGRSDFIHPYMGNMS